MGGTNPIGVGDVFWLLAIGSSFVGLSGVITAVIAFLAFRAIEREHARALEAERRSAADRRLAEDMASRWKNAEERILQMQTAPSKNSAEWWGVANVLERTMSPLLEAQQRAQEMSAAIENAALMNEWLRMGGSPHASWGQIVEWKRGTLKSTAPRRKNNGD